MTSNRSKEWRDEFKKDFYGEFCDGVGNSTYYEMEEKLFSFIEWVLSQQRAELIEKVEGLPNYEMSPVKRKKVALSDVLQLLKGEL